MQLKLLQLNKDIVKSAFVGKVNFSDLQNIAEITFRKVTSDGNTNNLFQRPSDDIKIKKISNFIKKALLNENGSLKKNGDSIVLFPTAIIVSLNEKDENIDSEIKWDQEFLDFDTNLYKAFIIDGQHRFLGIKKFYEETGLSFDAIDIEIPVTVLVGYDMWEQSKLFAVVNFEQKPVNKSLYYDIFGSFEGEYDEFTLSHSIVKHLNYKEGSPFFGLIKMLGTGSGVISQAFLVGKIKDLFKAPKAFSILYDEYKSKKIQPILLSNIISIYFDVIKQKFNLYYPVTKEGQNYSALNQPILFKTTGLGAFFRLLNDFGTEIKIYSNDSDTEHLNQYFTKMFSLISTEEARRLFGKDGEFSHGGGEGLQVRLYKEIKLIIEYKKDVIGKIYNNAEIIETAKEPPDNFKRVYHVLKLNNGTTTKVSEEQLENIRKQEKER
jgi:DGQHR domain-containing protein